MGLPRKVKAGAGGDPPFAWFLREWRIYRGLTQDELGEAFGKGKGQISAYETLERVPNAYQIAQLAERLGIQPWELFRDPTAPGFFVTGAEADLVARLRALTPESAALFEAMLDRLLRAG